jgi:hypothetical protein
MEQRHLLLIDVSVVGAILREVVKPLDVLIDTLQILLQVQELLKLVSYQPHGYVVSTKGLVELGPWHLVVVLKSGGEVSPPSTSGPTKLLGHIQSHLELGTVQEPKLGLGDAKPIIRLKRIRCLGEQRRVHRLGVGVGGVQHLLVVWLTASLVHEVLCQHPHELILCG